MLKNLKISLLFLLFFTLFFTSSPKFMSGPISVPSDIFTQCYFNPLCFCKYDQKTAVLESLQNLWESSLFNLSNFKLKLESMLKIMEADISTYYFIQPDEISELGVKITNGSMGNTRGFDSPLHEFECSEVPLALVPTEFNAHGLISHVSVSGSKLIMLDGSAFAGLDIQGITLTKNQLYYISEFAFSSTSSSLSMLDLSMNYLDELPFSAFKTLKRLEWLNLSNNLLISLSGEWFSVRDSVRKLLLSSNSIETLPSHLLSSFPRLLSLDLSHNFLSNLSTQSLPRNLQTLNLNHNAFSSFPLPVFQLESISWLFLSACSIESVPTQWPSSLLPLQMNQVDLSQNLIQHWPSRAFGGELIVLDLSLSSNYLTSLPSGSFENMSLFRLSLGYNRISHLDPGAFSSLSHSLKFLNLENNLLTSFPWAPLLNLTSLIHLYMGSNSITHILPPPPSLHGECKFTYLGLNGNELSRFPKSLLFHCPHLVHLNLGYNQIPHLHDLLSFHGPKSLIHLSTLILRNNPIRSLSSFGDISKNIMGSNGSSDNYKSTSDPLEDWGNNEGKFEKNPEFLAGGGSEVRIKNIFRPEIVPNLKELSLSFCQLAGELEAFPQLDHLATLEISMGLKTATNLGPNLFSSLKNLEWLSLDHNSLQYISDYTFFSNVKLSYVNLEWNQLSEWSPNIFSPSLHNGLSHLLLSHNKLTQIYPNTFNSFPSKILDLSHNFLTTLHSNAFRNSENSSYFKKYEPLSLYLSHNKITKIKSKAFNNREYRLIDLSYNSLDYFNFDTIGPVVKLLNLSHNTIKNVENLSKERHLVRSLDLSFNKIVKYLELSMICVSELLDLSHNELERLDQFLFPLNCSAKEVKLSGNFILTLDPGAFTNLRDLTALHFDNTQLSQFPTISFIRNAQLRFVNLSKNKLRSIPRDGLVGSSIEILNLSYNQFVTIPISALSQISRHLKILELSHNFIEHLDSTMFDSVPSLISLDLSSNRLSSLPDSAFANLASLRELHLSHNLLRANFKELFHLLPNLKVLGLSHCGIKIFPFLPLPHLVNLNLAGNGLREIHYSSLSSLGKLRELDLSNNELHGQKLPIWTPLHRLTSLKLSQNPLKSLTKDTLYGMNRLEKLEILDLGRVERFDTDVFAHMQNLRSLSLETYPNIEKYRFRLGQVLSSMPELEEVYVRVRESVLSDQLIGGILPKLKKLTITGGDLKRIESGAFEGLQNSYSMDLSIVNTSIEEVPPRLFHLLQLGSWAKLNLSFNKLSSLDSAALYPNKTVWFSKGTKILEGGLILEGNEFVCDCDLVWIGEWFRRWLRESFQSHSSQTPQNVHSAHNSLSIPHCTEPKGRKIPLLSLYSDELCHASALSSALPLPLLHYSLLYAYNLILLIYAFLL